MRRNDDRHHLIGVGLVLEDGREAYPVVAKDPGDLRHHAGYIHRHQAKVIAGLEFVDGQHIGGAVGCRGEDAELLEGQRGDAHSDVDDVGDDGAGGGELAGAAAVKKGVTEGAAVDTDGVETSADV